MGLAAATGLVLTAVGIEAVSAWAARHGVGPATALARREVVLVLGFGNPGRRANAVNRWRVDVGLRSRGHDAEQSVVVMCGGAVHGELAESHLMARYARIECGVRGAIGIEDSSTTTAENIERAVPFCEGADRIVIASDPLHALRARIWLARMRPDLAEHLVRARDRRLLERSLMSVPLTVIGLEGLRRVITDRPRTLPAWPDHG